MTVVHKNPDGSVVIEISGGYAVAVERSRDSRAGFEGDVAKSAVVLVPVEKLTLAECTVEAETFVIEFGIDVTIRHEDVGPAVIVNIEEKRAPSQEL
jgi:hypothetical protein